MNKPAHHANALPVDLASYSDKLEKASLGKLSHRAIEAVTYLKQLTLHERREVARWLARNNARDGLRSSPLYSPEHRYASPEGELKRRIVEADLVESLGTLSVSVLTRLNALAIETADLAKKLRSKTPGGKRERNAEIIRLSQLGKSAGEIQKALKGKKGKDGKSWETSRGAIEQVIGRGKKKKTAAVDSLPSPEQLLDVANRCHEIIAIVIAELQKSGFSVVP